ncbi:MAG: paraquat-inducible protein A [Silicimonas sp.]|nr:paraquat-inducible protein A [Silicimonas sp.]
MERALAQKDILTAREARLVGCRHCAEAWPFGTTRCERCGSRLSSRDNKSLQRVWAWWIAGLICYIPANTEPMLRTRTLFHEEESTIVGGAVELYEHGDPLIALIILAASVGIPVAKFLCIAYLALSITRGTDRSPLARHRMYDVVEYIGRWSMIDVFVVAILSSLVHFSAVASVSPGPASLAFALSVVFTMLSAQSFDSRLIWDRPDTARPAH